MHDPSRRRPPVYDPVAALTRVDRHIAEGRAIIRRQIAVLRQMKQDGLPTRHGYELLSALRETVEQLRHHRRIVLDAMPVRQAEDA